MGISSLITSFDAALSELLSQWNGYSTGLATVLAILLSYAIFTRTDPDIHPMLLARQSHGSPVRQKGESSIYRGNSAPHGLGLNSGLNVRPPGTSKWSKGRDGDLRDVWRRVVTGTEEGNAKGRILTVMGSEKVIEHKLEDITRQINLVGQHISAQGGSRVAIYLPNSVELMATLFACSFYKLTAVLVPFDPSLAPDTVLSILRRAEADTIVTSPGYFPLFGISQAYPGLKSLVWVVDEGNKHLDWNEVPEDMNSTFNTSTYQDILKDGPASAGTDLPTSTDPSEAPDVIIFCPRQNNEKGEEEELVTFTQQNLVAGISAQLTAVPTASRFSPADLFVSAAPLTSSLPLSLTLAALYANASVAFNSVAGSSPDLSLATVGAAPTVVIATPQTILQTHAQGAFRLSAPLARFSHWLSTRSLLQTGAMTAPTPGKLRLLYIAAGADTPRLSATQLSDLRVFTGAQIAYALTASPVAGAVAQTLIHDYRVAVGGPGEAHFGPPVSSVEIYLRDRGSHCTSEDGEKVEGEIVVRGPAVVGGERSLGVVGRVGMDGCVGLI